MAQTTLVLLFLHAVCCVLQISAQVAVPTKPAKCVVKSADIAFVIDASGSVDSTEWKQSLDFASNVINGYDVGKDKVRVALIVFSTTAQIVFDFNRYTTKAQVIAAIANAPKESQNTYTNVALDLARTQLFQTARGMRPQVPNILVVVTDGESTDKTATVTSANALKRTGLTVIAVGVKGAVPAELQTIASKPNLVYNYGDFTKLVALQNTFSQEFCKVAVKLAPTTLPPPPPTTTAPPCVVKTADIAFILDASGSVGPTEWAQSLTFARNIVSGYDIGKDQVRVALIEFSSNARILFDFNKYPTKAAVLSAITNAKQNTGGTETHKALDLARTQLFTPAKGMRPNVPNIAFVITDGRSNSASKTLSSAKLLHGRKVTVFAVGVKGAQVSELQGIASDPTLVYNYQDFTKLAAIQSIFNKKACDVVVKLAPSPVPAVPTKPKPNSGCSTNEADIVFVVDTSTSVGLDNFNLTKTFLSNMMLQLDFTKNRVGIIQFNDKASTVFELKQNNDRVAAQASVDRMQYDKGPATRISAALKYMREHSFTAAQGDRPNVANIAILLTDGQSKEPFRTQYEANATKKAGIELFAVGVGKDINVAELKALASSLNFVYQVQTFGQLAGIQSALAGKLCQGFTIPPSTTVAPYLCKDTVSDCEGYGSNICFEAKYRQFAEDKCPAYCDVCPKGSIRKLPDPVPCKDNINDCLRRIDICTPKYLGYAKANCAKFCNYCGILNPTPIIQTTRPTTPRATFRPTVPRITRPPVPTKTTPYSICDTNCYDLKRDCKDYNLGNCKRQDQQYFFKTNCAESCGYCTPKPACVTTKGPCVDKIDCSGYADSSCVDFKSWAAENCPQRCGLCPGQTPVMVRPTSAPLCEDKEDCPAYGNDVCTDFPEFSKRNCRVFCNICTPSVPVTTPKCVDLRNCAVYKKEFCVDPDYRAFMVKECRAYCNIC